MRTIMSLALVLAMAGLVAAQEPKPIPGDGEKGQRPGAPAKVTPTPGGDTVQGLQKLTEEILAAAKSGDPEKLAPLVKGLVLKNHEVWFAKVFGPEVGAKLAGDYGKRLPKLEPELTRIFMDRAREPGLELKVLRIDKAGGKDATAEQNDALAAMKAPIGLYTLRWMRADNPQTDKLKTDAPKAVPPKGDEPKGVPPKMDEPKGVPPLGDEPTLGTGAPVAQLFSFAFIDDGFRFVGEMKGAKKPEGKGIQ